MDKKEALSRLLDRFDAYYNVKREDVEAPFAAEAIFHTHDEQYFLIKMAKVSESEAHENVYFSLEEDLTPERVLALSDIAWERGLKGFEPAYGHRSTDVLLFILADSVSPETEAAVKKLKKYRSYRLGIYGWSHFKLVAIEPSSQRVVTNHQGETLRKLVRNIF